METKTENKGIQCSICGEEIVGEYMQASVNGDLKPTEKGVVVCSKDCAEEYEQTLPHQGNPIQHFSRITGYYQNISGWNAGKKQELQDRRRYGIQEGNEK